MLRRRISVTLPAFAFLVLVGCQGEEKLPRVAVEGIVSVDGNMLDEGAVSLTGVDGTKCPKIYLKVSEGGFMINEEYGPVPGTYEAKIVLGVEEAAAERDANANANTGGRAAPGSTSPLQAAPGVDLSKSVVTEKTTRVTIPDENPAKLRIAF